MHIDAAAVPKWMADNLAFNGIPIHHLAVDPDVLPGERIRVFYIDQSRIERFLEAGAASQIILLMITVQ